MEWTQVIGLAGGICTSSSMIPQVVKTFKKKKAEDVSLLMLLTLTAGLVLWVIYGFMKNDLPIIITNIFAFTVNLLMVILRQVYKNRD